MSIKLRSFLSFGLIFLLLMFLWMYQQQNSSSQIEQIQTIKDRTLQTSLLSDELKLSVVQVQQYLSDISATRGQNGLDDGFEQAKKYSDVFYHDIQTLKELNPNDVERLNSIEQSFQIYYALGQKMANQYVKHGPQKGNQIMLEFDKAATDINDKVNVFQQENTEKITQSIEDIEQLIQKNTVFFNWMIAIVFVIGAIVAIFLSRSIIAPLHRLILSTEAIAKGDLNQSVSLQSKDEVGTLSQSFEQMRIQLSKLIQKIDTTSKEIVSSSEQLTTSAGKNEKATEEITSAMQEVAFVTERQATDSSNSSRFISEVSQGMTQAAQAIQTVTDLGQHAKSNAGQGNQVVQETLKQMNQIHQKVDSTFEVIQRLDQKSREIDQIISIITDIANQTNLLSLNAAIESARAGEHGKGFAVVAGEVKQLAEQSEQSANEIRKLIEEIQLESKNAIQSMKEGIAAVQGGMNLTAQTDDSFNEIAKLIEDISVQNHEVSAVVEQVNASTGGIVEMIQRMTHTSEESAANAQNVAIAAEEQHTSMKDISSSVEGLSNMANDLKKLVNQFKL
ncbi:HAMP domain-containing methyl-accepting chemotaxis protein [Bacillus sp. FJAT-52991]|uniref:HAMP domain-containing methyl-accepting chemotaxis protein n=1 Tax=Bacillus kandeliae TaxID=3129297 RepID=A0ABZ2N5L2_9BACI